ncbi:MAG: hypothetical protein WAV00_01450, partial [Nocardioides sp.]
MDQHPALRISQRHPVATSRCAVLSCVFPIKISGSTLRPVIPVSSTGLQELNQVMGVLTLHGSPVASIGQRIALGCGSQDLLGGPHILDKPSL